MATASALEIDRAVRTREAGALEAMALHMASPSPPGLTPVMTEKC